MLTQLGPSLLVILWGLAFLALASDRSFWSYFGAMVALIGFLSIPVGFAMGYFIIPAH